MMTKNMLHIQAPDNNAIVLILG